MEKYPGIENTELFKALQRCMKERVSEHFENEFLYPDNSKGWFELSIEPVTEGLFILSMDITERKKAEEERKEHLKKIEEMMFMTSHRVRTPLAHIQGVSGLLDNAVHTQDELKQMAGYMKESVLSLDAFTKELTEFIYQLDQKVKNRKFN